MAERAARQRDEDQAEMYVPHLRVLRSPEPELSPEEKRAQAVRSASAKKQEARLPFMQPKYHTLNGKREPYFSHMVEVGALEAVSEYEEAFKRRERERTGDHTVYNAALDGFRVLREEIETVIVSRAPDELQGVVRQDVDTFRDAVRMHWWATNAPLQEFGAPPVPVEPSRIHEIAS